MQATRSERDQLVEKLQAGSFLRGLSTETLAQMVRSAVWRDYAPGAVIFLEGDAAPALYYVDTGWVKVVKMSLEGREQILQFFGPGEIFGGMGVFVDPPAPATAIALEQTGLWLLQRDAVRRMLATNPAMALQVIEFMADRLTELVTLVATYVHLVVDDPTLFLLQPEEPIIPIIVIALCLYLLWSGSGSWRLDRRVMPAYVSSISISNDVLICTLPLMVR